MATPVHARSEVSRGGSGWFGISVASAGDFTGDGYPDIIIGARNAAPSGKARADEAGTLKPEAVAALFREHREAHADRSQMLYALAMFAL